jgi:methylenetetrahydrofolate reductase (NADPH)
MPLFSPRRFQPHFLPVSTAGPAERVFTAIERWIKDVLFGCRMCGNCILQETAFVCPMTCPKGLRNGPCGEADTDHCVVDPSRPCTWVLIFQRAERMGKIESLLEINAPLDGLRAGKESWLHLLHYWQQRGQGPRLGDFVFNRGRYEHQAKRMFYEYRQPDWWQGDSQYHAPAYEAPLSRLETSLRSHSMVVSAEIAVPEDDNPEMVREKAQQLIGKVVSANFSDNAFAISRAGSLACSKLSLEAGLEPVLQVQARDRSRLMIQSEVIGASMLGIRNILCLSGNYQNKGPSPISPPVQFDLDVVQMLWMLRRMRDEGKTLDGRVLENPPKVFLGAAGSPFAAPHEYDAVRGEKKVNAGAQFLQTQMVFDYPMFLDWMEALDKRSLLDKVVVMASVLLVDYAADVRMMAGNPGNSIPHEIIQRMDMAEATDIEGSNQAQVEEGVQIALEMIEKLKATPSVGGIHLMLEGKEDLVERILTEASLLHVLDDKI